MQKKKGSGVLEGVKNLGSSLSTTTSEAVDL